MTAAAAAAIACVLCAAQLAHAQPAPVAVEQSGLDEHVGAQLPVSTPFTEPHLGDVTLGMMFDGKRPVLLVLAYARCTMLCSLVLHGVSDVAKKLTRSDYQLVLISLDARETRDEAARKQTALLASLGADTSDPTRWPYLLGTRANIDAVANALGFRYAWDARTEQYAHPAVIFAVSPDGRVARYLHGVEFDPDEVNTALDDAKARRFVSREAEDVMRCFHFDPALRRAGARVQRFLRIGALCVFVALLLLVGALVRWERRRGGAR